MLETIITYFSIALGIATLVIPAKWPLRKETSKQFKQGKTKTIIKGNDGKTSIAGYIFYTCAGSLLVVQLIGGYFTSKKEMNDGYYKKSVTNSLETVKDSQSKVSDTVGLLNLRIARLAEESKLQHAQDISMRREDSRKFDFIFNTVQDNMRLKGLRLDKKLNIFNITDNSNKTVNNSNNTVDNSRSVIGVRGDNVTIKDLSIITLLPQ